MTCFLFTNKNQIKKIYVRKSNKVHPQKRLFILVHYFIKNKKKVHSFFSFKIPIFNEWPKFSFCSKNNEHLNKLFTKMSELKMDNLSVEWTFLELWLWNFKNKKSKKKKGKMDKTDLFFLRGWSMFPNPCIPTSQNLSVCSDHKHALIAFPFHHQLVISFF